MRLENCVIYDNVIRTYNKMRLLGMKKNGKSNTFTGIPFDFSVHTFYNVRFSYRIHKNLFD